MKKTLTKINRQIQEKSKQDLEKLYQDRKLVNRLLVSERSEIIIIPVEDISYIEAQDDYVSIYTINDSYLKYDRISRLEASLDKDKFCRVHRSYIVNLAYIKKIESISKDSRILVLKDKSKIPVSRSGYERLIKVI